MTPARATASPSPDLLPGKHGFGASGFSTDCAVLTEAHGDELGSCLRLNGSGAPVRNGAGVESRRSLPTESAYPRVFRLVGTRLMGSTGRRGRGTPGTMFNSEL